MMGPQGAGHGEEDAGHGEDQEAEGGGVEAGAHGAREDEAAPTAEGAPSPQSEAAYKFNKMAWDWMSMVNMMPSWCNLGWTDSGGRALVEAMA